MLSRGLLGSITVAAMLGSAGATLASDLVLNSLETDLVLNSHEAVSRSWTGAYAGVFVGGALPNFENHWNPGLFYEVPTFDAVNSIDQAGAIAGVRIGANYDLGGVVAGIEADASLAWLQNSTYYVRPSTGDVTNSERAEFTLDAMASVRGKLGVAFDDVMVFGTAGLSYVSADFAASTSDTDPRIGIQSLSNWVPTVGAGVDWRISENVVIGATALYHMVEDDRFVGGLGDGDTDESFIGFNDLVTIDVSLKYLF